MDKWKREQKEIMLESPDGQITIDGNPHEGIDGYRPEGNFEISNKPTHDVSIDPSSHQSRIYRERND